MIDVVLLRILRKRPDYMKLQGIVPKANLDKQTLALIADFGKYFEKFPTHSTIDYETFMPRFKAWHPALKDDQFNQYKAVVQNSMKEADQDQRHNIIQWLSEVQMMTALANLSNDFNEGDVDDTYRAVSNVVDEYRKQLDIKTVSYIDIPIGELLQDEFDNSGLKWRLNCLNESMRPLRPGDFGIIAGRPDKGKTTFLSSEITHLAPQLPPDRNVLWLNNEGPGKRIIPRLYQSALGYSMEEMKERYAAGTLDNEYRASVGGRKDRIRIVDIHGFNNSQVEQIIEDSNPGIVIYDMIDNIRGFGSEARTDLALEEMYKWARESCVKYDCIGLATSQISNDGDGQQFPTLGMLKDSKTGKQGACDFQLMIGASNDPGPACDGWSMHGAMRCSRHL